MPSNYPLAWARWTWFWVWFGFGSGSLGFGGAPLSAGFGPTRNQARACVVMSAVNSVMAAGVTVGRHWRRAVR